MAPQNIRRAQRHEMFVPKGTATVSDVYPKMKQFDLHTLLRLRTDGSLTRVSSYLLFLLILCFYFAFIFKIPPVYLNFFFMSIILFHIDDPAAERGF